MTARRSGLGRGLESLIPADPGSGDSVSGYIDVPVDQIRPNPDQPRHRFDDESLQELAASIEEVGVLQPVVVAHHDDGFQLIAGERRWRAAKRAGLSMIPAVVRTSEGESTLIEALVENVQRQDLTPIEEAQAFSQLLEDFGMTQEQIATRVGKSRPTISNTLRLLQLGETIQRMVDEGSLSAGHARSLIPVEDEKFAVHLAEKAVEEGWSVRQLEEAVRVRKDLETGSTPQVRQLRPVEIIELENRLTDHLGVPVKISYRRERGKLEIKFSSVEELERLYRTFID